MSSSLVNFNDIHMKLLESSVMTKIFSVVTTNHYNNYELRDKEILYQVGIMCKLDFAIKQIGKILRYSTKRERIDFVKCGLINFDNNLSDEKIKVRLVILHDFIYNKLHTLFSRISTFKYYIEHPDKCEYVVTDNDIDTFNIVIENVIIPLIKE